MIYYVVAKKYDDEQRKIVPYVAATCDREDNAVMFMRSYNSNYNADAKIIKFDPLKQYLQEE